MNKKYLLCLGLGLSLLAPESKAQTIFTIGNVAVSKEEFLRGYQKNAGNSALKYDAKSINDYLNLYALYKMKVKEAESLGLDTVSAIKSEVENYKYQLAKSYLVNKQAVDELALEAYNRTKKERSVSHILVQAYSGQAGDASSKLIDSIYSVINSGKATFESMAQKYSMDRGTAENGGNLGYINAFQTPYVFESMAYNTPVGSVSKPFKTEFGYHIIKVNNERDAAGEVEVAQILLTASSPSTVEEKLALARDIKAKVNAGADFTTFVHQYSEDPYSVSNDGVLAPFGAGKTDARIENAAFALKNPGDISDPVITSFGIHILKLIKKIPLGSYEQEKGKFITNVENNSRLEIAKAKETAILKQKMGFKEYPHTLTGMINTINQNELEKGNQLGSYPQLQAVLFEVPGKKYSQQDFLNYIFSLTQGRLNGRKEETFNELYKLYTDKVLSDIQMKNLEATNSEYNNLVSEYRNGVLLFDLMDKNIWTKATSDTAGLRSFFNKNQSKYIWNPGFEGSILKSKNTRAMRQIESALKTGKPVQDALDLVNTPENSEKIYEQTGRFEYGYVSMFAPESLVAKKPTPIMNDGNNGEIIVFPTKVYKTAMPKTLEDAKGSVIDDYQKSLEAAWERSLKEKYPLKINTQVVNTIIK